MQAEIERFLAGLVGEGCTANTIAAYRNDLQQLKGYLVQYAAANLWASVTPDEARSYMLYLWDRGYAVSTVARKVSAIRSFFHFLLDQNLITSDPLTTIGTPRVDRSKPESLPPKAMDQLLIHSSHKDTPIALRDQALLELLRATGLRASEVVRLEVEDVSFASSTVCCLSRGRERLIPLPVRAREALDAYASRGRIHLLRDRNEGALFLNHRGGRLTRQGLWLLVQGYAKRAGLKCKVNPQALRHSFATRLLSEGVKVVEVQELLGHVSLHTTQAYAAESDAHPRGDADVSSE